MKRSLALLFFLPALASAAIPARYRFHVVRDKLVAKLSAGARQNERAIAAFPHATAFVVAADPKQPQRVLVLTNNHVAGGTPPGDVKFRDGTVGKALRTVASSTTLDYAIVEVSLASGPRAAGVEPMSLERSKNPMQASERIYALGGHVGLDVFRVPRDSIAGGPKVEQAVAAEIATVQERGDVAGFRTLAVGRSFRSTRGPEPIVVGGNSTEVVESDLPNAPGMSGSPIISRATHRVVGLHSGGTGSQTQLWTESAVPIDLVLGDLRHQLAAKAVDTTARDLLQRLVDGP